MLGEITDCEQRRDPLVLLELEQVDECPPARRRTDIGQFVDLADKDPSRGGEKEHGGVGRCDKELPDLVLGLGRHSPAAAATAALGAIDRDRRALDVAVAGDGDDHILLGDEVLDGEITEIGDDLGPAVVAILGPDLLEFLDDDVGDHRFGTENRLEMGDGLFEFGVLIDDLVPLQAREPLQTHLENCLGLTFGETEALHETVLRRHRIGGCADQLDDLHRGCRGR